MRSSQKLKLLRSLGSCPSGTSPSQHLNLQNHHSIPGSNKASQSPRHRRTLGASNHSTAASSKAPLNQTSGIRTGNWKEGFAEKAQVHELVDLPIMDNQELTGEIKVKALTICRDYLHGAWKQIELRDLSLKRISGGLSNYLYHCSLPLTLVPSGNEPAEVLLRFYGQVHGEDALESLITESVIFTLLSERKLGPKLYGIFPGGRIEQFIPARPLLTDELRVPELSVLIAQKMAQIHALNIPISKEASWLWGTMDRWMTSIRETLSTGPDAKNPEAVLKLSQYDLDAELKWLRHFLENCGSPVVFSHNDMQEGNILIRPEYSLLNEKLVLIDFEYCSYNFRGFDLANHFCEWSFNYKVEAHPNFKYTEVDLPSDAQQLGFIREYVGILRAEFERNFYFGDRESLENSVMFDEEHILKEVKVFTLASHFFWVLWAFVNAEVSKIPFGYWEYGLSRLDTYFQLKKNFV